MAFTYTSSAKAITTKFEMFLLRHANYNYGSGCFSVGRTVASDFRGQWFESSQQQNLYGPFTVNCIEVQLNHFGLEKIWRKEICSLFA